MSGAVQALLVRKNQLVQQIQEDLRPDLDAHLSDVRTAKKRLDALQERTDAAQARLTAAQTEIRELDEAISIIQRNTPEPPFPGRPKPRPIADNPQA